jgi:hypothetical protein
VSADSGVEFYEGDSGLTEGYSLRSVTLLAGVLGRAGERGQQRRLADANDGVCTWETPSDVRHFIKKDAAQKENEVAEARQQAKDAGELEEKRATREDFLTDDELLRELMDAPIMPKK